MIAVLVWTALGAALSASAWSVARPMFDVPALQRTNYRNAPILTGAGVLVPVVLFVLVAVALLWERAMPTLSAWSILLRPSITAAAGFSMLGLLDDIAGDGQSGGFRGHLVELRQGRLTSGMLKLGAGAALGLVVVATAEPAWLGATGARGMLDLLRDGAIVALAANTANLFDRAPGRMIKVVALVFAVVAVVSRSPSLAVPAGGVGAGVGLLRADLRERCMLGDAGSNALGALCGLAALTATPAASARWVILGVLVLANLASEAVSFSRVIDSVGPLRWFDRLGSERPR